MHSTRAAPRFTAANAQSQGAAAADDAIARATALGLAAGSPIYFDMEAYALNDAACTQAVLRRSSRRGSTELHARGYVAGVYGSAASTDARHAARSPARPSGPDDLWIANWNGNESVFGDPYVSDALWTSHQRIHQYRGGHNETWGGVTINVDSDYVDGAGRQRLGRRPPPPPAEPVATSAREHATTGMASASWPAGSARRRHRRRSSTRPCPGVTLPGYGTGGYGVQLQATSFDDADAACVAFAAPVTLTFAPRSGRLAPVYSTNGTVWKHVPQLVGDAIAPGRAHRLHARRRRRLRDPDDGRRLRSRSCPTGSRRRRRPSVTGALRRRRARARRGARRPTATGRSRATA